MTRSDFKERFRGQFLTHNLCIQRYESVSLGSGYPVKVGEYFADSYIETFYQGFIFCLNSGLKNA